MTYTKTDLKTHFYTLAFSLISIISMQSCVDSIPIPAQEVDAMLVFESDISPNGFSARISTSADLTDVTATSIPSDLEVTIEYSNEDVFNLMYNNECLCYSANVAPISNETYTLRAKSPINDIYEDIDARMTFPRVTSASELEAIRKMNDDGTTTLDAMITLDAKQYSGNYYHIIPFRKITEIVIVDQEQDEVYTGAIEPLDQIDFNNTIIDVESHYHKGGFLVDFKDLDISSTPLNLTLHTSTVIDYETQAFTKVFYEIRSVTEYYYRYELYKSRIYGSQNGFKVDEPISSSNITNGRGYFGSYNSTIDSISVL